jgi:hypothetical protein
VSAVAISQTGLLFTNYPYPPASVYPSGAVEWASVCEIGPSAAPPEVRLLSGETLFVPAPLRDQLFQSASDGGVPSVARVDVWGLILEPFLDTAFSKRHREETLTTLAENGLAPAECSALRRSLSRPMRHYNIHSGLWDWAHLGLADALDALGGYGVGTAVPESLRLGPAEFSAFYKNAMAIASRARKVSGA